MDGVETNRVDFAERALGHPRPDSIAEVDLPRRVQYYPSPVDWRDEVLYFLLPDRFSDGQESHRKLLDRRRPHESRPPGWRWDLWVESGAHRWQGGTLRGVESKLGYLRKLGVTALWIGPVFKQRGNRNTYYGYGVQDFLDVDPHFGTRRDLVRLVRSAHDLGMRVVLDVVFNHTGFNWIYPDGREAPPYLPYAERYPFGAWLGAFGQPIDRITNLEEGVWPLELQREDAYTRAGFGDLGAGDIADPNAEHKRSDFEQFRDLGLSSPGVLDALIRCYQYWIALTDCDGFRIDTLKHVGLEEARRFCGAIAEYANNLGKMNFFLVGEIAGGDNAQDRYLDVLGRNLSAALDIGEMRAALGAVAKGLAHPSIYFDGFDPGRAVMGSHRALGRHHVSVLDDHDCVYGERARFSTDATSEHQVAAAVAIQLFTLGIPCIYYGTEQAFAGPEPAARDELPGWRTRDWYLREAMFGHEHPLRDARGGLAPLPTGLDPNLPGFGPFGTSGRHCFDSNSPAFRRIAAMSALRARLPVLRHGRQYPRPISVLGGPFGSYGPGEIVAWSRVLSNDEALCVVNAHGTAPRGADVMIDTALAADEGAMTVVLNTAEIGARRAGRIAHPVGSTAPIKRRPDNGASYIEIRGLPPSEVLVLLHRP